MSADINMGDAAISGAWASVTRDGSDSNWFLISHKAGSRSDLELVGTGSGGFNELKEHLDDSRVMFGVIKVIGVDDKETTTSRRAKYVFVTFIGERVSVLVKARVSVQKGQITPAFHGVQAYLDFGSKDEVTMEVIGQKLAGCGGAHKPSYYEFGPGQKWNLDFYHTGSG